MYVYTHIHIHIYTIYIYYLYNFFFLSAAVMSVIYVKSKPPVHAAAQCSSYGDPHYSVSFHIC